MTPPAVRHRGTNKNVYDNDVVLVTVFRPDKGVWEGPVQLLTWGRGYACVSTDNGQTEWVPAKWIQPILNEHGRRRGGDKKTVGPINKDTNHVVEGATS